MRWQNTRMNNRRSYDGFTACIMSLPILYRLFLGGSLLHFSRDCLKMILRDHKRQSLFLLSCGYKSSFERIAEFEYSRSIFQSQK